MVSPLGSNVRLFCHLATEDASDVGFALQSGNILLTQTPSSYSTTCLLGVCKVRNTFRLLPS